MKLQEKLDQLKQGFEAKAPKDAMDVMHRATEDLRRSGILKRTVKVGERAPEFSLQDTDGNTVTLKELLARGPVVLSFYRGRW